MSRGVRGIEQNTCSVLEIDRLRELYLDSVVPRVHKSELSPLSFYRDYVAQNKPVVITGAFDDWDALHLWTNDYLRDTLGDKLVSVAITPDGYADAVHDGKFMLPEERLMAFSGFLDILERQSDHMGIFYIQKQNSNFSEEYGVLHTDAQLDIDWATQAFGKKPDAVNFWMGDQRAVTSMHKDHYENMYCVVNGTKTFTLLPPTDAPFVPYDFYPMATYKQSGAKFEIIANENNDKVPWINLDPTNPDLKAHPQFANAHPIRVSVSKGEMLYLPSLWFHHVSQSHACIALNYWYDMEYDIKYNYFKMVESLSSLVKSGASKKKDSDSL